MSVEELLERLKHGRLGDTLDWRQIREEIHDLHDRATTTTERVTLLEIFTALMDEIERSGISGPDLDRFREARRQDYALLLVREARVGNNVCTETIFEITAREVAAGRMAADDALRTSAVEVMAAPHYSREQLMEMAAEEERKARSIIGRIKRFLR